MYPGTASGLLLGPDNTSPGRSPSHLSTYLSIFPQVTDKTNSYRGLIPIQIVCLISIMGLVSRPCFQNWSQLQSFHPIVITIFFPPVDSWIKFAHMNLCEVWTVRYHDRTHSEGTMIKSCLAVPESRNICFVQCLYKHAGLILHNNILSVVEGVKIKILTWKWMLTHTGQTLQRRCATCEHMNSFSICKSNLNIY